MERTDKTLNITINYITLYFIISTCLLVMGNSALVLYHIDKIQYSQMIEIIFIGFRITYYLLIALSLSLLAKVVIYLTDWIRNRRKGGLNND